MDNIETANLSEVQEIIYLVNEVYGYLGEALLSLNQVLGIKIADKIKLAEIVAAKEIVEAIAARKQVDNTFR